MPKASGSNIKDVKNHNRSLILKLICTNPPLSRSQLAIKTNLTKMTLSNIISELISSGIIIENKASADFESTSVGRRPILLDISGSSPCICGMLIKRGLCQVILSDLRGHVLDSISIKYDRINSADDLIRILLDSYHQLCERSTRKIIAISISSLGPVDTKKGIFLNPPDFFGLSNIAIVDIIEKSTKKPTFLINDANAGALAEKIYGLGQNVSNFVYLHIMNGIGAGVVLDNKLYEGNTGQSCEFGHTGISFTGPKCSCGNTGCLDLYANIEKMNEKANGLRYAYPNSVIFSRDHLTWSDYVNFAHQNDLLAIIVLDEFCNYVSHALTNMLNLLDINLVIVGYNCDTQGTFIEDALSSKINKTVLYSNYNQIEVKRSSFMGDGPLIGSIAVVTDKIFNSSFNNYENSDSSLNSMLLEETK